MICDVRADGRRLGLLVGLWVGCGLLAVLVMASPLSAADTLVAMHLAPALVWVVGSVVILRRAVVPSLLLAGQLGLLLMVLAAPGWASLALVGGLVVAMGEEVLLRILPMLALRAAALPLRLVVLSGTGVLFFLAHTRRDNIFALDLGVATLGLTVLAVVRVPPALLIGLHLASNVMRHAWVSLGGLNGLYVLADVIMFSAVTVAVTASLRRPLRPGPVVTKVVSTCA